MTRPDPLTPLIVTNKAINPELAIYFFIYYKNMFDLGMITCKKKNLSDFHFLIFVF
jgi:hypothetical protein